MNPLTKIAFGLFVGSLFAAYFSAIPAVMSALVFLALYGEERFVQYAERVTLEEITKQLEAHQTALNALNMRMGMGPLPSNKIVGK